MIPPKTASASPDSPSPSWSDLAEPRSSVLQKLRRRSTSDLLIVGGGIAGATLARLAAFNGLRVTLLERGDYASATSGRSSKMAHGGLRYLQMLDFAQVGEGVLSREDLFASAPHLVRPHPFLIPVKTGDNWARYKFGIGLSLYDFLARAARQNRHRWIPARELGTTSLTSIKDTLSGAYQFVDGIMDDARLVIENVIAARQEGAICLNYAEFLNFEVRRDRSVTVAWRDRISGQEHTTTTGIIANCAGPWVTRLGRITAHPELGEVAYSRGVHLLFSTPWPGAALLLPMPERGRLYFVWPHPGGTLVGTTEAATQQPEWDPLPTRGEIEEILMRLARDLPAAGLNRDTLHYAFAGIRTLPLRGSTRGRRNGVSRLSRRHRWVHTAGMISLVGGKYTSAARASHEGLKKIFTLSDIVSPLIGVEGRKFPGAWALADAGETFSAAAQGAGVPRELITRALARFGSRVSQLASLSNPLEVIGGCVLRGEVELALRAEQVEDLQDLMGRRLGLEYLPGHGLAALDEIGAIMLEVWSATRPDINAPAERIEEQKSQYRARVATVEAILAVEPASQFRATSSATTAVER